MLTRGDLMDSDQQENHYKKRSERHQKKKPLQNEETPKTRSDRHAKKQSMNNEPEQHIDEQLEEDQSQAKTRSERHHQADEATNEEEQPVVSKHSSKKRIALKRLVISLGTVFVLSLIAYTTILYGGKLFVDENKLPVSGPTSIQNENGETVWQLYEQYRKPVTLEEIPEDMQNAFVATEDKRFYTHSGVDFRSIMRALYKDIISRSKAEGASTITQQLAKNLFLSNDKSWLRKTKEVMIALYLEREYSKDEILEMYMNVIYFGQGVHGVEAASNTFFNKSAEELTLEESALLAGIVNAPNAYSPIDHQDRAIKRRNLVLDRMEEADFISEEAKSTAQAADINLELTQRMTNDDAYQTFAYMVVKEAEEKYDITLDELKNQHYEIKTEFNAVAQQAAYEAFKSDSYFPGSDPETVQGAFVMMNGKTGAIAAALGGRNYNYGDLNRVTQMYRQPGSTMKPLAVYGPALETEDYNPYVMLPDEKQEWDGKEVKNSDDQYAGEVSLYNALINSKNTSAVWLLNELGLGFSEKYLNKMDITIDKKKDGLGVALGGLTDGLTPLQIAQAYTVFGNQGTMTEAHVISEIKDRKGKVVASAEPKQTKVFTEQTAWTMTEMLQGVVREGTGQAGSYPKALAGKTGTTQETNDIWFAGFTPEYVTALWMGYDNADEDHYLTGGSSSPTALTKQILTQVDQQIGLTGEFTQPEDVQAMQAPIELPNIDNLSSTYGFGGLTLLEAKLEWPDPGDERIIYRIYEAHEDGEDEKIAEVTGESEYVVDKFSLFKKRSFYVVPYDSLGDREGEPSNITTISF